MRYKLLTDESDNLKLLKSSKSEYYSVGLSLAPHSLAGVNVCQFSTPVCRKHCVAFSGNGSIPSVSDARIRKTKLFFSDRKAFLADLKNDLEKARDAAKSNGRNLACRLNVFSDIPWERVDPGLFVEFSDVQFYDYTKNPNRAVNFAVGLFPPNYHLTFSRSEANERTAIAVLMKGCNVAVVLSQFRNTPLPSTWHGITMIDGDKIDLRFLDPKGVVVGLRAKGTMRNEASSFVDRGPTQQHLLDTLS